MGSIALHLFTPQIAPPSSPTPPGAPRRFSATRCRFSARYGERSSKAKERPKFDEDYRTFGDYAENDVFGYSTGSKKRTWWSDDESSWDDDEDDDDDYDEFGPFGVLEGSISFSWIFKLVQAFGWMVPAVIISMVMGTGPNAFIMAMAIPLAQTAFNLVLDTFWDQPNDRSRARPKPKPKPKPRTKKRPFTRPVNSSKTREQEQNDTQTSKSVKDYQSWVAGNNSSSKKSETSPENFGGWDELDKQEISKKTQVENSNEPKIQKKSKVSRRMRKRDSPLLIRLLISVFPFFGFWTKLM